MVGAFVVTVAGLYVFLALNGFRDLLLFENTTPNGGDTGAHVWWPAFMRDHVFPNLRLSGWAQDWYAGFPVGHFYFPLPALLIVGLDLAMPYNVAFKLVTALGPVTLPAAAYYFARSLRTPWPAAPLFAAVTLPYLFFTGYTIYGGNLPSMLAGEFSYSIGLSLALFALGSLARALDEGRRLWLPALLIALTVMTHGIVMVFVAVGAVVIWLARHPVRTFPVAVAVGAVAVLLTAIWTIPLVAGSAFMTDMGWGKLTDYRVNLLHDDLRWAIVLGGVALVSGAAFLRRATLELAALTLVFGLAFVVWPHEARLWNARLLPFYYLSLMFLAAMGVAELVNLVRTGLQSTWLHRALAGRASDETGSRPVPEATDEDALPSDEGVAIGTGSRLHRTGTMLGSVVAVIAVLGSLVYVGDDDVRSFIPGWVRWNNTGYEAKGAFPEYQEIMDTLRPLPPGRLLWERLDRINDYGSDLALELIPHFTDSRVGSMEGLYFESAGTTPYHFLTVSELASEPSNPVRGLDYGNLNDDFDQGVRHLQMMGVRYFMAGSDEAKQKASDHPDLVFRTQIPGPERTPIVTRWAVYEVRDSDLVEPLTHEPVVVRGLDRPGAAPWTWFVDPNQWRDHAASWWMDPTQHDRPLATSGPDGWARSDPAVAALAARERLPDVDVSDVDIDQEEVRFSVSRTGVPVLVKVSYFPNWQVQGAEGPWRVTPNFMVVVPTEHDVELTYERRGIDRAAIAMTLLGVVGLVALARWRPRRAIGDPDRVPST